MPLGSGGSVVLLLVSSAVSVLATVAVLAFRAHVRYARRRPSFRCRVRAPRRGRRRRARWCRRRTRAFWAGDVLMVRTGVLRLWLTPLSGGIPADASLQTVGPGTMRGLGGRPMALRFTAPDGSDLEVAVAAEDVDRLVGPYLTAMLPGLPEGRREHGR